MPLTPAQKQARRRERLGRAGLVQIQLFARPEHRHLIRAYAASLSTSAPASADGTDEHAHAPSSTCPHPSRPGA